MTTILSVKQPTEAYSISFDFSNALSLETIGSATATAVDFSSGVDATLTIIDGTKQSNTDSVVYVWVKSGVSGHNYALTCFVTSNTGSVYELDAILPVIETPSGTGSASGNMVIAPQVEPVSLADMKTHMRIESTFTAEDDYIETLISVAREYVENIINRKTITQIWYSYYSCWPNDTDYLSIQYNPVISVSAVTYLDSLNVRHTWSATEYDVDTTDTPARIVLGYSDSWPSDTLASRNPIRVEYVAGYGPDGTAVPKPILQAIKILVSDMYEAREQFIVGKSVYATNVVDNLLASYRLWKF